MTDEHTVGRIAPAHFLHGHVETSIAQLSVEPVRFGEGIVLDVNHPLHTFGEEPDAINLYDPEAGDIEQITCSAASKIERIVEPGATTVIRLTRARDQHFDGATLHLRIRWGRRAMKRPYGGPACVVPSQLPRLITPHGPVYFGSTVEPTAPAELTRYVVERPPDRHAGRVRDAEGRTLMLALPVAKRLARHVWYADDAMVLGGPLFDAMSQSQRATVRDKLLAMHRFLGEELGYPERVRVLAFHDADARSTRGSELLKLDARFLVLLQEDLVSGESEITAEVAALWWNYGVQPAGRGGDLLATALSFYASLRWFTVTASRKVLDVKLDYLRGVVSRIERENLHAIHGNLLWSARLALVLYETSTGGPALGNELRRWFATYWGQAVPVKTLKESLAKVGAS